MAGEKGKVHPMKQMQTQMTDDASALHVSDEAAAAVAVAPRVSLSDIEAAIAARYDFPADKAVAAIGSPVVDPLKLLTICILVMKNGFTVIGKSAPASPANFNEELGQRFAYEDAIRQLWPLMGFALRDRLHRADLAVGGLGAPQHQAQIPDSGGTDSGPPVAYLGDDYKPKVSEEQAAAAKQAELARNEELARIRRQPVPESISVTAGTYTAPVVEVQPARMRAKMRVQFVQQHDGSELLQFNAVGPKGSYPSDGSDEDNTYAKYTPNASLSMTINNPALLGKFKPGDTFYLDFTPAA
jgi:hypothetical protein